MDAGTYEVTAEVDLPDGYVLDCDRLGATLTVLKATYNLSGVNFTARSLTYTGSEQVVSLTGVLPNGISVTYTGNRATEVGTYVARATFSGENENYEKIPDMTCKYTISPKVYNLPEKGFGNEEKTYDGDPYTLKLKDLPDGVTARYYIKDEETYTEVTAHTYTDAGVYPCYVRLTANATIAKNYDFTTEGSSLTFTEEGNGYTSGYALATLTVNKARLEQGELVLRDPNGYEADSMVYGNELTVGSVKTGAFSLLAEGKRPVGAKGEFTGLVSVEYDTGGIGINNKGLAKYGTYVVTATYVMPGEYRKNYLDPTPLEYRLIVVKATYDTSLITFTAENDSATFNGEEFVFFPANYNEEEVKVTYSYRKDGAGVQSVRHAGSYEVTARFTLKEDAENYYPLPDMSLAFTVFPRRFDLDVTFDDLTTTYDGTVKSVTVTENVPVPEKMTITYMKNASVDAGVFEASAEFAYEDTYYYETDYVVYIGGRKTKILYATLTVQKANYTAEDVAGIAAQTGLTYSYGMKLRAVPFTGDDNGYVAWKNPQQEIGTLVSIDDATGYFDAKAVYYPERNASIHNHNEYEFTVRIALNKKVIDLTDAVVADQFVARNGTELPVFVDFAGGANDSELNAEINTSVTFTGAPNATITVTPKREGNYVVIGQNTFAGVKIYPYDRAEYTYEIGSTALLKYLGSGSVVTVPDGTTEIRTLAFKDTAVTAITVSETVLSIADNALYGTRSLRELTMPDLTIFAGSVKKAFGASEQGNLKVTLENTTEIPAGKFSSMTFLTEVKCNKPLTSIGEEAFLGCSSLTTLTFNPTSLKTIGQNALAGCTALTSLTLPSLVGDTEGSAVSLAYYFGASSQRCALHSVTLNTTAAYVLAPNAFSDAKFALLEVLNLSDSLTEIGANAFNGVAVDLDLSGTAVTVLGENALSGFKGRQLILPAGLTRIETAALKGVNSVQSIIVPAGVTLIARKAFENCTADVSFEDDSLYTAVGIETFCDYAGENVTLPNVLSIAEKAFKGAKNLATIYFGSALQTVGERAFEGCASLTEIVLPDSLTSIGDWAFLNCSQLSKVTFNRLTPPTESATSVFDTKGGILTVVLKVGADNVAYEAYLEACGSGGKYILTYKN